MVARVKTSLAVVLTVCLACGALAACNTVAGMGDDVSAAGHAVSRGAEKVKSSVY